MELRQHDNHQRPSTEQHSGSKVADVSLTSTVSTVFQDRCSPAAVALALL
jgi:hypothetical protein